MSVNLKVRREGKKVLIEFETEKDYENFRQIINEARMALSNRFFDVEGKEIEILQKGDEYA